MTENYKPSTAEIKVLRDETSVPIMEARRALADSRGDLEQAKKLLAQRGQQIAGKKSTREVREGFIGHYIHQGGKMGALVELACETDFVARSEVFQRLAHEIALHVCASRPTYINRDEVPEDVRRAKTAELNGQIEKFYEEAVLLDQPYVRDEAVTVNDVIASKVGVLGENIKVRRFARFDISES